MGPESVRRGLALLIAALATPALAGPTVDAPGRLPEPPPSVPDLAYDSRLLSSAAAAEQFQGALDGGWTLSADAAVGGQGDLYAFQLVDKRDHIEGAWRDLRRPGDPAASGFVDQLQRTPEGLVIRFTPAPGRPTTVVLRADLRGELTGDGRAVPVTLRRTAP